MAILAGCGAREEHVYRITAPSMEPTLHCARPTVGCRAIEADRVYVVPYGNERPQRGDIVAFEPPPKARHLCGAAGIYLKRVVRRLRDHRYVLLGDNRPASCDSRVYGAVAESAIRGKAVEIKRGSERIHLR